MPVSRGSGKIASTQIKSLGTGSVIEDSVLIFHPEMITIGAEVYIGHMVILEGYHCGNIAIGDGSWIGAQTYMHGAGGITIGCHVGIGPGVRILTSTHSLDGTGPVMDGPLLFAPVYIEDGADIGVGAVLLPGVTVGAGAQVGAGAVVTSDIPPLAVATGMPARVTGWRS